MCGEGRRKGLWSTSAAIHNIKAFIFFLCCCWLNFLLHLLMLRWTFRPLHKLLFYPCLLCSCFGKKERVGRESQLSHLKQLAGCLPVGWCSLLALSRSWGNLWQRQMMARWSLSDENGSGPSEEECFPHQQSLLSPSLKVGNGGMVAWWTTFFFLLYVLHANALTAYRGCLCRLWSQLQSSHWFDGNKPSISHGRNSWTDENTWLFDKILFFLNSNISLYR